MVFPRWIGYLQGSLLGKITQSIDPNWSTVEKRDENRIYVTRSSYVGSCPSAARPGDAVYILSGYRVPHVLQKCNNGRSGYTLIGDAFVYEAMDGELMNSDMNQVGLEMFWNGCLCIERISMIKCHSLDVNLCSGTEAVRDKSQLQHAFDQVDNTIPVINCYNRCLSTGSLSLCQPASFR